MTDESRLIELLDKLNAMAKMPRDDRIRAARIEIDANRDILGLGPVSYAGDDGKPWGRIDPETKVWSQLEKEPILKSGGGPPPFYWTAPNGSFVHVVHQPEPAAFRAQGAQT